MAVNEQLGWTIMSKLFTREQKLCSFINYHLSTWITSGVWMVEESKILRLSDPIRYTCPIDLKLKLYQETRKN